jgi:hypothetical protein
VKASRQLVRDDDGQWELLAGPGFGLDDFLWRLGTFEHRDADAVVQVWIWRRERGSFDGLAKVESGQ